MPDISIIILTHNAHDFLKLTLTSVYTQRGVDYEVIVVDNNSNDNTKEMVTSQFPQAQFVARDTSIGFSAGNNEGVRRAKSDTILFLNPDVTFTKPDDLAQCYAKLCSDDKIGALTPRVNLVLNNQIDETSHRGFPTPWASFTHFSQLSRIFPKVPLFNQYTKNYLGYDHEHTIDAVGGMFMMLKRSVGEKVGWWDEDYPFYGEDLDFCYRLTEATYHNLYFPSVTVLHYKGATTGMSAQSAKISTAKKTTIRQVKIWSVQAMELFYRKHYASKYPFFVNWMVYLGIKLMYFVRVTLG
jgi:GT2 family glycosyltransferase